MRCSAWILFALVTGCGAKSGLSVGPPADRPDAGGSFDAGDVDAEVLCAARCDDGIVCNGREVCDPITRACITSPAPPCDDGDECTVDTCDAPTDRCSNVVMDLDRDRDGVTSCSGDCDDENPAIRPGAPEVCQMIDDDCDDRIDEGVLSECADCRPGCHIVEMPEEVEWVPTEENSAGVVLTPSGELVLSSTRTEFNYGWIANSEEGSITKLDLRTGAQAAEYHSVLDLPTNNPRPPDEICRTSSRGGNCPSRTAVDLRGAVYVANRAFFAQPTVTKIAGLEEDCLDRNGNGVIDTSADQDADGIIERDVPGEFLGQDDECILWTVDVGPLAGIARAIAIAADGNVWVGLHDAHRVLELDPDDGTVLRNLVLPTSFQPYGAAIDGRGRLWLVAAGTGSIKPIDTATGEIGVTQTATSREGCSGSYGIATDAADRVWIAGFQCTAAFRFDPETSRWFEVSLPDSGAGRGIAADDRGYIYMASSHTRLTITPIGGIDLGDEITRVTRFRADDGTDVRIYGTPDAPLPGRASTGVGLDPMRRIWLINQSSGSATRVDPETGAAREFPVGAGPYTYSDFTGYALRTFTAPNGYLRTIVEGCAVGPTEWEELTFDAVAPARTRVEVRVRAASSAAELASATWIGPFTASPANLAAPPGPIPPLAVLEVEVTLVSEDEMTSPRVRGVNVQYNCPF
jgi:streptogramin lyase